MDTTKSLRPPSTVIKQSGQKPAAAQSRPSNLAQSKLSIFAPNSHVAASKPPVSQQAASTRIPKKPGISVPVPAPSKIALATRNLPKPTSHSTVRPKQVSSTVTTRPPASSVAHLRKPTVALSASSSTNSSQTSLIRSPRPISARVTTESTSTLPSISSPNLKQEARSLVTLSNNTTQSLSPEEQKPQKLNIETANFAEPDTGLPTPSSVNNGLDLAPLLQELSGDVGSIRELLEKLHHHLGVTKAHDEQSLVEENRRLKAELTVLQSKMTALQAITSPTESDFTSLPQNFEPYAGVTRHAGPSLYYTPRK